MCTKYYPGRFALNIRILRDTLSERLNGKLYSEQNRHVLVGLHEFAPAQRS